MGRDNNLISAPSTNGRTNAPDTERDVSGSRVQFTTSSYYSTWRCSTRNLQEMSSSSEMIQLHTHSEIGPWNSWHGKINPTRGEGSGSNYCASLQVESRRNPRLRPGLAIGIGWAKSKPWRVERPQPPRASGQHCLKAAGLAPVVVPENRAARSACPAQQNMGVYTDLFVLEREPANR